MYFKSDLADYMCEEYLEFKITGHINFIYTSQVVLVWLPLLSFGLSQNLEE